MDYCATIEVDTDVSTSTRAIRMEMDKWWSLRVKQSTHQATVRFHNSHATFSFDPEATEQRFEWTCTDAKMIIQGISDHAEWKGTKLTWELKSSSKGSRITLTHQGLNKTLACHSVCTAGWERYFENSLKAQLNGNTRDRIVWHFAPNCPLARRPLAPYDCGRRVLPFTCPGVSFQWP